MTKVSLVLGGQGALGRAIVQTMRQAGWNVVSLDLTANSDATTNVIFNPNLSMKEQAPNLVAQTL
jgi:NAD(P)-dependent dehydrogenase (short-subunit alcohol dehydrogenase family)